MEKINLVLEKINAVKGFVKGKNNRRKYYLENLDKLESISIEFIQTYNFEQEVKNWDKEIRDFEQKKGKYSK